MSHEILQTGLQLAKQAVEADTSKQYTLASQLYEQAILNLKLAIVSEKDPSRTALVKTKIEEYTNRNKFIKNLASSSSSSTSTGVGGNSNNSNAIFNFPSIPSSVSPSVANVTLPSTNTYMTTSVVQPSSASINQFPSAGGVGMNQSTSSFGSTGSSNDTLSKLSSMPSVGDQFSSKSTMGRVEADEVAMGLVAKGKREEELRDYRKASSYYEQACSYFLLAIKGEPDSIIKQSLNDKAKIYLERVEKLKPYVQHQLQLAAQQQQQQQQQLAAQQQQSNFPTLPNINNSGGNISMASFPNVSSSSSSSSSLSGFPPIVNNNNNNHNHHLSTGSIGNMSTMMSSASGISPPPSTQTINIMPGNGLDRCAACNAILSTNSIRALERTWHPECFSVSIICAGCQKPFSLTNLSLKVKDNKAYHPLCFESTTGLYQEERRTFVGSSKYLFFSIQLQRKFYRAGETIQFGFLIDNPTSKKVDKVVAYILMTETRMEIVGSAYDRRAKKTTAKLGRCEFHNSTRFPLVKDRFEGDFFYAIPPNILPSEVAGVDASFVREYQLVVKCVGPPLKIMTVKLRFNLTILNKQ
ncbi:LIM-type zinc finger-containing protein [Cavenderia fasciculata]|uniref:LIM-type zinc finger-containing protein n=1 Tax=Cavenderia fasciculata TaxID=261658 RepID=F4Q1Z3_CACFS|nr:LIM-type zinc finger-containing protein [Cavenderia fasciculata]EGG18013.1 LIM-type zinc finger-containing protein [Cavenderia fasciculata]|eukprot:XP_004356906.1 LIM-type zinc finger-containing protein [Cavenderia fasciculata]